MKKIIYGLLLSLVVVSGLMYANCNLKTEVSNKPLTVAERKAALKKWEGSKDGIAFTTWKASPAGQNVLSGVRNLRKSVTDFTAMEGVVTSLTLPAGSRLGFGVLVQIKGVDYILAFGSDQVAGLQVYDKIVIKSHSFSFAPKYAYPIVAGDYVARGGKVLYKRVVRKGGC
jgi:hypothetical protein